MTEVCVWESVSYHKTGKQGELKGICLIDGKLKGMVISGSLRLLYPEQNIFSVF
jgi:hypothetical protein